MANMAVDSWLPRRFSSLSERLTIHNGVLLMGAASLAALMAYPAAIEPLLPVDRQLRWWSGGYLLLVLLAAVLGVTGISQWLFPSRSVPEKSLGDPHINAGI